MGNLLGRNTAKVMKITGESFKIKTPAVAAEALKAHPDHVLFNADAVKHFGVRAKPLDPAQPLRPKNLYFLVPDEVTAAPRPHRRPVSGRAAIRRRPEEAGSSGGKVRVKVRLPRAVVDKLMEESRDNAEVAGKIIDLYIGSTGAGKRPAGKFIFRPESKWKPAVGSIMEGFG